MLFAFSFKLVYLPCGEAGEQDGSRDPSHEAGKVGHTGERRKGKAVEVKKARKNQDVYEKWNELDVVMGLMLG